MRSTLLILMIASAALSSCATLGTSSKGSERTSPDPARTAPGATLPEPARGPGESPHASTESEPGRAFAGGPATVRDPDPNFLPASPGVVGQPVYAVEKAETFRFGGSEVFLFEGIATEETKAGLEVRLTRRFKYRNYPNAPEGVDPTNWWCTPERRHCYSEVEFSDWAGKHVPGDSVEFPRSQVFSRDAGLVSTCQTALRRQAER